MVMVFYDSVRTTNKVIAVVLEAFVDFMGVRPLHWSFDIDALFAYRPTFFISNVEPSFVEPKATLNALVFNDADDQGYGESSNG